MNLLTVGFIGGMALSGRHLDAVRPRHVQRPGKLKAQREALPPSPILQQGALATSFVTTTVPTSTPTTTTPPSSSSSGGASCSGTSGTLNDKLVDVAGRVT